MTTESAFFDELARVSDRLRSSDDNEAIRHDLLVRPILTSPFGLGWDSGEALSQIETPLTTTVSESYYWRGATPRKKRPDIVLVPYRVGRVVGVVEEKRRQSTVNALESHAGQLLEYQYLHRCVWGLLTDGEKWVLTKNHEIFHRFESLSDLNRRIADLRHCIGRAAILDRMTKFGTTDLVIVRPSRTLLILGFPGANPSVTEMQHFLRIPSREGVDLVHYLFRSMKGDVFQRLDDVTDTDTRSLLRSLFGSGFSNYASPVVMAGDALLDVEFQKDKEVKAIYERAVPRWSAKFPHFQSAQSYIKSGNTPTPSWLMDLCTEVEYYPLWGLSAPFLEEARSHVLTGGGNPSALDAIDAALMSGKTDAWTDEGRTTRASNATS